MMDKSTLTSARVTKSHESASDNDKTEHSVPKGDKIDKKKRSRVSNTTKPKKENFVSSIKRKKDSTDESKNAALSKKRSVAAARKASNVKKAFR